MATPLVLVLHDDADVADALCDLLSVYGLRAVAGTTRTPDAVAAARPAAVVLDAPARRRAEAGALIRALRGDDRTARVPILVMARGHGSSSGDAAVGDGPAVVIERAPLGGLQIVARVSDLLGARARPR